jgi:hypothetical protein
MKMKITGDRNNQNILAAVGICIGPSLSGVGFAERAWVS